jgi:hypothetical protein
MAEKNRMKLDRLAYPGPDDLDQFIIEASAGPKGKEIPLPKVRRRGRDGHLLWMGTSRPPPSGAAWWESRLFIPIENSKACGAKPTPKPVSGLAGSLSATLTRNCAQPDRMHCQRQRATDQTRTLRLNYSYKSS